MPVQFDKCVANGGRVRTKDLDKGKYLHICFPKGGGPSLAGEIKTKQDKTIHSPMGHVYKR